MWRALFERDVGRVSAAAPIGTTGPIAARELLAALAWGYGPGVPDDGWAAPATTLSKTESNYQVADVYWALAVAGRYVVAGAGGRRSAYRCPTDASLNTTPNASWRGDRLSPGLWWDGEAPEELTRSGVGQTFTMETTDGYAAGEDGTPISFQVTGQGPAVLLVHSAAADARQWSRVVPLLSRRFTTVTMDRRGRRRSGPIGPLHSLDVECGDVAAVVASIGRPVHLVGHSSGARYALHAAVRIPNLASLTLYEPPEPENVTDVIIESLVELEARDDREGILWTFFGVVLGLSREDFSDLKHRPIWPLMLDNALTLPAELRAVQSYRIDPVPLAALRVPELLLVGELSDPEDLHTTNALHAILPKSRIVTLPGQGHGAMFSAPLLFSTVLTEFIDTVEGS